MIFIKKFTEMVSISKSFPLRNGKHASIIFIRKYKGMVSIPPSYLYRNAKKCQAYPIIFLDKW